MQGVRKKVPHRIFALVTNNSITDTLANVKVMTWVVILNVF